MRIKVKNILNDCLLFCCSKLLAVRSSFCAKAHSLGIIRERAAFNVKGLSSSLVALEFARNIGYNVLYKRVMHTSEQRTFAKTLLKPLLYIIV